jgi:hypothetical protein
MERDVASFGADLLLAGAGFGVLLALGLRPSGGVSALGAVGLAYLAGTAIVPLALTILLVLGVPFGLPVFFAVVFACVLVGAWRAALSIGPPQLPEPRGWLRAWRAWTPATWLIGFFAVALGGFAVVGFLNAIESPMYDGDAWTIWARKAQVLFVHSSLWGPFFENPAYAFTHLDYPLQLPIWEAIHLRAAGSQDTQPLLGHVWLLLVAFVWAVAYLLHVHGRVQPFVWAPLLLLVFTAPAVWQQASGSADLPLAMFVCLGAISLALWLNGGDVRLLALATLMLAAAANTKNEGMATVVAVLAVAAGVVLVCRLDRRAFLIAAGVVVGVGVLPWRIWLATHGIEGDIPVSSGVDPGYLIDRIERVRPSIDGINAQLADQSRWVYLVPLAALAIVASLVSGLARRVATFYLGVLLVIWAIFVWSYWISPYDLNWHLATSASRVVSVIVLVCVAAVLHLSGIFASALARPPDPPE